MLRGRTYETGKVAGMYESKKVKRYRSAFTTSQINYLEKQYENCPYIGSATRKEVANLLNISERAIKIWFQNRRMKEKKEVNTAEYNVNSHDNIVNDTKFAKDSLINAHSSQSANDRQCSLQSAVIKHDTNNFSPYYNNYAFLSQCKNGNLKKEINDKHKSYESKGEMDKNMKQEVERKCLLQPEHFMEYNLNKKYNNKNFINYLELNKKSSPKSKVMTKTTVKEENFRDRMQNIPSTSPQYQDLPEDLSARNLSNVIIPQNHQGNIQFSPAYIPFCNTQDMCISAGNVIWKPVNVMPALSPSAVSVAVPEKVHLNQNKAQECKCSCNCHSRNGMTYDQNLKTQPQYVIAIPYNNNMNIL